MKIRNTNIRAKNISFHNYGQKAQNFKIKPNYFKKITKVEESAYKLELTVEILNTESNPFPLDLSLEFETIFSFSDYESMDEIDKFLNHNAIQMIFPFMRSSINSVVSAALLPPLILPIIDVRQFKTR